MHGFFYNSSIRNYMLVVSKLFSDVYVMRKKGEDTYLNRVPVNMIDENKIVSARGKINRHDSDYNIAKVDNIFPKINIKLVDMVPNTLFSVGSTTYINKYGEIQHSPAPVTLLFEANIMTKSMNDSSMIMEQIVPYLRPHFTVEMMEIINGRIQHKRDVRIVFQTASINNDSLGGHENDTVYDWSIIFEMVGNIYPPQINRYEQGNVIKTVFLNFKGNEVEIDNTEIPEEFESVDIQVDDLSIDTKEDWIDGGAKTKESYTSNIQVPENDPSEIRK